jgi:predicted MFS family arabinose efflux permease
MSSLNHWMIVTMIVPIFVTQGASTDFAVLAAACVGPAQVAGRLLLLRYEARIGTKPAMQLTVLGSVLASLILLAAGLAPVLVLSYAILQGAAVGIATILRPVLIAEVMGPEGYGTIAGMIQIPALLAGAGAPVLGAAILAGPGVAALMGLSLVLSCTAFMAVVALRRMY